MYVCALIIFCVRACGTRFCARACMRARMCAHVCVCVHVCVRKCSIYWLVNGWVGRLLAGDFARLHDHGLAILIKVSAMRADVCVYVRVCACVCMCLCAWLKGVHPVLKLRPMSRMKKMLMHQSHLCVYVCICVCMCVCARTGVRARVHACVLVCACMRAYTRSHVGGSSD